MALSKEIETQCTASARASMEQALYDSNTSDVIRKILIEKLPAVGRVVVPQIEFKKKR